MGRGARCPVRKARYLSAVLAVVLVAVDPAIGVVLEPIEHPSLGAAQVTIGFKPPFQSSHRALLMNQGPGFAPGQLSAGRALGNPQGLVGLTGINSR